MLGVLFGPQRGARPTALAAAGLVTLVLAMALPAVAGAQTGPRFLLVSAPGGADFSTVPAGPIAGHVPGATPLGTPTWLWVVCTARHGRWGRVVLPLRPNGRLGWIDMRGLRRVHTRNWVRASLRERRIWLMRGAHPVARFRAAIGSSSTPTPTGRYSVTDRVLTGDPSGPFGWFAFGLSGHQPRLPPGWTGGDQLAIHGTNDPASIGTAASTGCLRVSPSALSRLRRSLELGTPVIVMSTRARSMAAARASSWPRLHPPARPRLQLAVMLTHRPPPGLQPVPGTRF